MMKQAFSLHACLLLCCFFACGRSTVAQNVFREKVYVHHDKSIYHAGENFWFAAYVLDAKTGRPSSLSKVVYLQLVDSGGATVAQTAAAVKEGLGGGLFELPLSLKPSIYTLIAYTRWMRNFDAVDFFSTPVCILNGYSGNENVILTRAPSSPVEGRLRISIEGQKDFKLRSPVDFKVSTTVDGKEVAAAMSVSVHRIDSGFSGEVPGITQWVQRELKSNKFHYQFSPELKGQWVTGGVTDQLGKTGARNTEVFVVVPGFASGFYNGRTDSAGRFAIQLREPVAYDSMLVLINTSKHKGYHISVDDPFIPSQELLTIVHRDHPSISAGKTIVNANRDVLEIQRGFSVRDFVLPSSIARDTVPFYGKHDRAFQLDDYTRFPKMEEVFREYVQLVNVNRRDGNFHLAVYNEPYGKMLEEDPLVLLDGYPIFNINNLFAFDPLKVRSIYVVTRRYFRASSTFEGIVNIVTYSRNLNSFPTDSDAVVKKNFLVQPPVMFKSPDYSTQPAAESHMPDFRNLLFWEKDARSTDDGNYSIHFFASDMPGDYLVEINAITQNGECGSQRKLIRIEK
jgi:hypothetical protein